MELRLDCKYYLGDRPCVFHQLCPCEQYDPIGIRILILKFAALGDVLRTTPILRGIKHKYPDSQITWLTSNQGCELLRHTSLIDRLIPYTFDNSVLLSEERFDVIYSLEKDPKIAALAMHLQASEKLGIGLSQYGTVYPLNVEAEYYFRLGLSNRLKFHDNTKTYQELIFKTTRLKYHNDEYVFDISEEDGRFGKQALQDLGVDIEAPIVGLNTGAGHIFANKAWTVSGYIELIDRLSEETDAQILLLGGPEEREKNGAIRSTCKGKVYDTGCNNALSKFCGILSECDVIVCGDTFAMHAGIALKKWIVAIFGPTCPQEIELYGRGTKIVSTIECAPCYLRHCDKTFTCMDAIPVDTVLAEVKTGLFRVEQGVS